MSFPFYISIGISILVLILNVIVYCTIRFNDLAHLCRDVKEIKDNLNKFIEKQHNLEKKFVRMATKCELRHKNK